MKIIRYINKVIKLFDLLLYRDIYRKTFLSHWPGAISRVSRDSHQTKFLLLRASSQGRIGGSQRFLLHWLSQPSGFKVSGHERERRKASCRARETKLFASGAYLHPVILLLRTPSCAFILKPPPHSSDRCETNARSCNKGEKICR